MILSPLWLFYSDNYVRVGTASRSGLSSFMLHNGQRYNDIRVVSLDFESGKSNRIPRDPEKAVSRFQNSKNDAVVVVTDFSQLVGGWQFTFS